MIKKIKNIAPQLFFYFFSLTSLMSCSSTSEKIFDEKMYTLGGAAITVNKGNIIASEVKGDVQTKRSWVGIANSDDGWGEAKITFSNNYIEKKLYYLGYDVNESLMYLMYREYKKGEDKPSILKTIKVNPEQNPFTKLGKYNIKILNVDKEQASFLLLDNNVWNSDQQAFIVEKDKKEKAEKLEQIMHTVESLRNEAEGAKDYTEQFNDLTFSLRSISQAKNGYNGLTSKINELKNRNYSTEQLIEIYQTLEQQLSQYSQFFAVVASSLQAWDAMDNDFKKAAQSGIGKEYFAMALDIKNSGDQALQAEEFSAAQQKYIQASQEISRITSYFQNSNSTFSNPEW